MKLPISRIRTDGGTQLREAMDQAVVDEYADAMERGDRFPRAVVFHDGADYWLADGHYRLYALVQLELEEIDCDVRGGTQEDARWYACAANQTNGLRRTNEDKAKVVRAALTHPMAVGMSNCDIARHCGVDETMVRTWRAKLSPTSVKPKSNKRTGRDGRTIDTTNIGGRKRAAAAGPEEEPAVLSPHMQKQGHAVMVMNLFLELTGRFTAFANRLVVERRWGDAEKLLESGMAALRPIIETIELEKEQKCPSR